MMSKDYSKCLYNEALDLVSNGIIIFREDTNGGIILFRGKHKNSGIEYYVDKGTIALLKLIKSGMSYQDLISYMVKLGLEKAEAEEIITKRLELITIEIKKLRDKGWNIKYWHPPTLKYPNLIAWEITWRCNLCCIYCFSDSGSKLPKNYHELSTDDVKKIIDKVKGKVLTIWLGGGEPFIRKDIIDIIKYLRRNDFFVMVSTNGALLYKNKDLIKQVSQLVDEVHIPLDGHIPGIHNSLRGEFNKVVWVIKEFVKNGANISSGTVITKINYSVVSDIIDFVYKLGVKAWVWTPVFPCGRGLKNKNLMITPDELIKLHYLLKEKVKEYNSKMLVMQYAPGVTPLYMKEPTLRCGAANYYIALMPNGDVYPCSYFRWGNYKLGNLLKEDLDTILNNPKIKMFKIDNWSDAIKSGFNKNSKCLDCVLLKEGYCNTGCKAMKISLGLDIFNEFPYCTRDVPGSPLHDLYVKLSSKMPNDNKFI